MIRVPRIADAACDPQRLVGRCSAPNRPILCIGGCDYLCARLRASGRAVGPLLLLALAGGIYAGAALALAQAEGWL